MLGGRKVASPTNRLWGHLSAMGIYHDLPPPRIRETSPLRDVR